MGCWIRPSSRTRAVLIALSEDAMYSNNVSPTMGLDSTGGFAKCDFSCWKACSHSSVHSNFLLPRRRLKNGMHLSVARHINLLSAATRPIKLCTSLCLRGEGMSIKALIFAGLASMPRALTINPKNFPDTTPKVHFRGFNFKLYHLKVANISSRSQACSPTVLDLTSMSSTYTSIF